MKKRTLVEIDMGQHIIKTSQIQIYIEFVKSIIAHVQETLRFEIDDDKTTSLYGVLLNDYVMWFFPTWECIIQVVGANLLTEITVKDSRACLEFNYSQKEDNRS